MIEGMPFGPGDVVAGKYRVERVLGAGGMGVVVLARHIELDERVAIKLLRKEALAREGSRERFLREARAAVKIKSDHVARVSDVAVTEDGTPYIVMEHLEGCDLAALLCAEGKQPIDAAVSYVLQACEAIGKAHALGIVHRDLKPANLFLATKDDGSARVKVLDFGISKILASASNGHAMTETKTVMGSPIYMSPEQLESARDVDGRADIWSLGVILYELLTGAQPFVGDTLPQLCKMITDRPAPSLRTERPDVPEALEAVVAKCLAKKREDRFASVTELAEALAPFTSEQERTASKLPRVLAATQVPRTHPGAVTPVRAEPKRWTYSWAFPAVGLATIGALAALWMGVHRIKVDPSALAAVSTAPLAAPGSKLACPQLRAKGVEEPSGWLGAAAAGVVCLRAQMRMGGRTSRTLVPAELLDLPRVPTDDFPHDPYGASDARDRELAAAAQRGSAYLDGEVEKRADDFAVALTLKAPDGRELARGAGEGATLVEAASAAMKPLENASTIPAAPDGNSFLLEWFGAKTAEAAEGLVDLHLAFGDESKSWVARECAKLPALEPSLSPLVAGLFRGECEDPSHDHPRSVPPVDSTSRGALQLSVGARIAAEADDSKNLDLAKVLGEAASAETSPEGRALLYAKEAACYEGWGDNGRANEAALLAIQSDPKAIPLTLFGTPWRQLVWTSQRSPAPEAFAWLPFDPMPADLMYNVEKDPETKLRFARRSATLARDGFFVEDFAWTLLEAGRREEAAPFIARVDRDGLRLDLEASYAHFGTVLARAPAMLAARPTTKGGSEGATEIAMAAAQSAAVLDRPTDIVGDMLERFVIPEPAVLNTNVVPLSRLLLACLLAPRATGQRCLARLQVLRKAGALGGQFTGMDAAIDGGERYVNGDFAGAAKAWRSLFGTGTWLLEWFQTPIAIAFDKTGQGDLAEEVDAPFTRKPGRYNGADLSYVRCALRAEKRGDKDRARKLAEIVINAWRVADEVPPAVDQMRKLLARLH